MRKPSYDLIQAKALIADPANHTKSAWARNLMGDVCFATSNMAVCFCAGGAISRVQGMSSPIDSPARTIQTDKAMQYLQNAAYRLFNASYARVNDEMSHSDVMAMFDKAIELAQAKGN